ncbi:CBS domain-containing protein [Nocardia transvalensis]|uniref:CBS domain-containing protein n=1 Tax=Nocardia transvalensis TaxID=37333 RepID=UPI000A01D2CD|nr:CBS domain-containing protein [Nocardia transvalensis]
MYARDILHRPVSTVQPKTPVSTAISLLTEHGFAALPVVDDGDHVLGMFSESDALSARPDQRAALVESVMTSPVEVVHPGTDVTSITTRMLTHHLRSIPVVEAGILVGIVARRDLLRALIRDDATLEAEIRALLDIYAGSRRTWTVDVTDGHAVIRGDFADSAERHTVSALALTVDGIDHVDIDTDRPPTADRPAMSVAERLRRRADEAIG